MFHMFSMFHDGGLTFIFYSLLSLIVFLMFLTKIRVSRVIISGTHTYMFHMFYMFHDRGVTFIFYSLLNLIVFLMFPTKIKPFQKWSFQERTFICFICLYVLWRKRNVYILLSSKSDRFPYVSNQNKPVSRVII